MIDFKLVDECYRLKGRLKKLKMRHDAYIWIAHGVRLIQETAIPSDNPEWRLKVFWNNNSGEEVDMKDLKKKISIVNDEIKVLNNKIHSMRGG